MKEWNGLERALRLSMGLDIGAHGIALLAVLEFKSLLQKDVPGLEKKENLTITLTGEEWRAAAGIFDRKAYARAKAKLEERGMIQIEKRGRILHITLWPSPEETTNERFTSESSVEERERTVRESSHNDVAENESIESGWCEEERIPVWQSQGTSPTLMNRTSNGIISGTMGGVFNEPLDEAFNETISETSDGTTSDTPDETPDELSVETSLGTFNGTLVGISDVIPGGRSYDISGETSWGTSAEASVKTSGGASDETSGRILDETSREPVPKSSRRFPTWPRILMNRFKPLSNPALTLTRYSLTRYSLKRNSLLNNTKTNNEIINNPNNNNEQRYNEQLMSNTIKQENQDRLHSQGIIGLKFRQLWREVMGHDLEPHEEDGLQTFIRLGFSEDIFIEALRYAVMADRKHMGYILGILRNWHNQNVREYRDIALVQQKWRDQQFLRRKPWISKEVSYSV